MEARFPEAESAARQAYERQQEVFGVEDPDTLEFGRRLAVSLEKQKRYTESEKAYRMVLDTRRRAVGPSFSPPSTRIFHGRASEEAAAGVGRPITILAGCGKILQIHSRP